MDGTMTHSAPQPPEDDTEFRLLDLPHDVILEILQKLEPKELGRTAQACQILRELADHNAVWRPLCSKVGLPPTEEYSSLKQYYNNCGCVRWINLDAGLIVDKGILQVAPNSGASPGWVSASTTLCMKKPGLFCWAIETTISYTPTYLAPANFFIGFSPKPLSGSFPGSGRERGVGYNLWDGAIRIDNKWTYVDRWNSQRWRYVRDKEPAVGELITVTCGVRLDMKAQLVSFYINGRLDNYKRYTTEYDEVHACVMFSSVANNAKIRYAPELLELDPEQLPKGSAQETLDEAEV